MKTHWIIQIFRNFTAKGRLENTKDKILDLTKGFTPDMQKEIVNSAITSATQVLISALVMTNSHNSIMGEVIFPDDTKWRLTFEKIGTEKY